MEPVADIVKLDAHLKEIVQALHDAVSWGMSHQKEPEMVNKAIKDLEEILDMIMEGNVKQWIN